MPPEETPVPAPAGQSTTPPPASTTAGSADDFEARYKGASRTINSQKEIIETLTKERDSWEAAHKESVNRFNRLQEDVNPKLARLAELEPQVAAFDSERADYQRKLAVAEKLAEYPQLSALKDTLNLTGTPEEVEARLKVAAAALGNQQAAAQAAANSNTTTTPLNENASLEGKRAELQRMRNEASNKGDSAAFKDATDKYFEVERQILQRDNAVDPWAYRETNP